MSTDGFYEAVSWPITLAPAAEGPKSLALIDSWSQSESSWIGNILLLLLSSSSDL